MSEEVFEGTAGSDLHAVVASSGKAARRRRPGARLQVAQRALRMAGDAARAARVRGARTRLARARPVRRGTPLCQQVLRLRRRRRQARRDHEVARPGAPHLHPRSQRGRRHRLRVHARPSRGHGGSPLRELRARDSSAGRRPIHHQRHQPRRTARAHPGPQGRVLLPRSRLRRPDEERPAHPPHGVPVADRRRAGAPTSA